MPSTASSLALPHLQGTHAAVTRHPQEDSLSLRTEFTISEIEETLNFSIGTSEDASDNKHSTSQTQTATHKLISFSSSEPLIRPVHKKNGFFAQTAALLIRIVQQKRRSPWSFAVDLLLPLLFIGVIIVLWKNFKMNKFGYAQYINYSTVWTNADPNWYINKVCYNETNGNTIDGLQPCSKAPFPNYICDGDQSAIPVKGLCHDARFTLVATTRSFLNSLLQRTYRLPSLDSVIVNQWLAALSASQGMWGTVSSLDTLGSGPLSSRYSAIGCHGLLYFAPASQIPPGLIDYLHKISPTLKYVYGGVFDTVSDALHHIESDNGWHWGLVQVNNMTINDFDVVIHLNSSALPPIRQVVDYKYAGGYRFDGSDVYAASGFLSIQQALGNFYLKNVIGLSVERDPVLLLTSMGRVPYSQSRLLLYGGIVVPFIIVLSLLYSVSRLTKMIVLEKELRIREAMLIMGLGMAPMYASWLVVYAVQYFVTCALITLMLKLTLLTESNFLIIFLVFYLFALTTIPLSGLLSTMFTRARVASMLSPLIYFVCTLPLFAVSSASGDVILGLSILSPTAFSAALYTIVRHELQSGFHAIHIRDPHDDPTLELLLVMLGVDFVVYTLLMLYLDAVLPRPWGTPRHPLFFVLDPWRHCFGRPEVFTGGPDGRCLSGVFEDDGDAEPSVVLQGLRKVFRRGGKDLVAVNNLYWSMRPNEIAVLLGHNGAGKSTTLNMMTGMLQPDAGDCYLYGKSVRRQLGKVRKEIGYCPQHNILWPELTCTEHLEFFGRLSGMWGAELRQSVLLLLDAVDLREKGACASNTLSGGQKRKLSVGLAFVGASRMVFLDEPTAGMDVAARRHTWELLQSMARTRTVLLTTHYMDEADLLGHSIGIMSLGRLRCSGSGLFLKSRLGLGYSLTISVQPEGLSAGVSELVKSHVPSAELVAESLCELAYRLPGADVSRFSSMLDGIHAAADTLLIKGYALSGTQLEEIFITLSTVSEEVPPVESKEPTMSDVPIVSCSPPSGDTELSSLVSAPVNKTVQEPVMVNLEPNCILWRSEKVESRTRHFAMQLGSALKKRLLNSLRDWQMIFFQIICPVVCILTAMLLNLINVSSGGSLELSSAAYGEEVEIVYGGCSALFNQPLSIDSAVVVTSAALLAETMSHSLVESWWSHDKQRYGAVYCNDTIINSMVGPNTILFYNTSGLHEAAIGVANYYNAMYKGIVGSSRSMKTTAKTLAKKSSEKNSNDAIKTILIGAIIMIPLTFLPSNVVAWIVKERECGARHLQRVSGLRFSVHWLATFLFDMGAFVLTSALVMVIFAIFRRVEYVASDTVGPTVVLLLLFGLSSTAAAYAASFFFREHTNAQMAVMGTSFASGFLLVMVVYMLSLMPDTKDAAEQMRWAFRVVPSFCLGEGIINLAQRKQNNVRESAWAMDTIGWPCVYMGAEFLPLIVLTLLADHPSVRRKLLSRLRMCLCCCCCWCCRGRRLGDIDACDAVAVGRSDDVVAPEDDDVVVEREQVLHDPQRLGDLVRVERLHHVYPNGKVALRDVTFGIHPGEVFALLGTNGAGKTTTTGVLCQQIVPTGGRALVCGVDVVADGSTALAWTGYCPQFDSLLDLLNVEEHLRLYAGIRGIVPGQVEEVVECLVSLFDLGLYRTTLAHELSGGNRRKLSVALALIGGPRVVLLDEPSAGMDPVARRGLWIAINAIAGSCAVVLTTHHLEEVESLAHRVAIMADGELRCIGDKTHLKTKFGTGFEVSLKVEDEARREQLEAFMAKQFVGSTLNEYHSLRYVYALPRDILLADIYRAILIHKDSLGITDYCVSHTSIEQVFLAVTGKKGVDLSDA